VGKINLPYVERNVAKGRIYYRYRRNGLRIALPDDPSSTEFSEAYARAHKSFDVPDMADCVMPGSIAELIGTYKKSSEHSELGKRTKELYADHLDDIRERFGKFTVKAMTRNVALSYRDSLANTPGKSNNAIKILSRLYSFAIDRGLATTNPILRVKKLKMGSYRRWTHDEIEQFRKAAPPYMQLALALALYTGQRQSDVIAMRWNQIKDNGIELRQQKTGAELWIPIHRNLNVELEKARQAQRVDTTIIPTTIIATRNGKPYQRGWFVAEWIKTSVSAGIPDGCTFHGLRGTASSYLAEAGCTDEQIQAITGHATKRMVEHYTKGANQKTLARAAIRKFERKLPNAVS